MALHVLMKICIELTNINFPNFDRFLFIPLDFKSYVVLTPKKTLYDPRHVSSVTTSMCTCVQCKHSGFVCNLYSPFGHLVWGKIPRHWQPGKLFCLTEATIYCVEGRHGPVRNKTVHFGRYRAFQKDGKNVTVPSTAGAKFNILTRAVRSDPMRMAFLKISPAIHCHGIHPYGLVFEKQWVVIASILFKKYIVKCHVGTCSWEFELDCSAITDRGELFSYSP